jgi:hypothetical protein
MDDNVRNLKQKVEARSSSTAFASSTRYSNICINQKKLFLLIDVSTPPATEPMQSFCIVVQITMKVLDGINKTSTCCGFFI